jgi:hypothetical protein
VFQRFHCYVEAHKEKVSQRAKEKKSKVSSARFHSPPQPISNLKSPIPKPKISYLPSTICHQPSSLAGPAPWAVVVQYIYCCNDWLAAHQRLPYFYTELPTSSPAKTKIITEWTSALYPAFLPRCSYCNDCRREIQRLPYLTFTALSTFHAIHPPLGRVRSKRPSYRKQTSK